jgi:D-alanyl-D-alanine carboxypeptidase
MPCDAPALFTILKPLLLPQTNCQVPHHRAPIQYQKLKGGDCMRIASVLCSFVLVTFIAVSAEAMPTAVAQRLSKATMTKQTKTQRPRSRAKSTRKNRKSVRHSTRAIAQPTIGNEGILVEDNAGNSISERAIHDAFNPASTLKLATALYVLRKLGPHHPYKRTIIKAGKPEVITMPLIAALKVMLCYSSNGMAEELGAMVGGPSQLRRLMLDEGLEANQLVVASASGLGANRITPRGLMIILRALDNELAKHKLSLTDVLPVAGVDPGTLLQRYATSERRGSIVAKTGTLIQTDGGASALAGKMSTKSGGTLYFVILHRRGNVPKMRARQDEIVAEVEDRFGGPLAFDYQPKELAFTLGKS